MAVEYNLYRPGKHPLFFRPPGGGVYAWGRSGSLHQPTTRRADSPPSTDAGPIYHHL